MTYWKEETSKKPRLFVGNCSMKYPEQIEGLSRFAQVYEAVGDRVKAAEYYRKSADFAAVNEGFDQKAVDMYLGDAERMESEGQGYFPHCGLI